MATSHRKGLITKTLDVVGPIAPGHEEILSGEALLFLEELHHRFEPRREELLRARIERQNVLDRGVRPDFSEETKSIRDSEWKVAPVPKALEERIVEITGPAERKMMINALNSGASVFMADFEDALAPSWENLLDGQINCRDAVRRTLSFQSPEGKDYRLQEKTATLLVRPRGWHLSEPALRVRETPISGGLFDFGLYFFHNAKELLSRGAGPFFYLPKLESHAEARLWADVFRFSEDAFGIPQGSIRATVLIETILAAFEMDEILYELRDYAAGLNAGRWDYIFSVIKKFAAEKDFRLPDRAKITMNAPFMRAYAQLLVETCHRRGAHAMGGMAAYVPSRKDPSANEVAFARVREDKEREAKDGFDGTWVAHPDLVPIAREVFESVLGGKPNQKNRLPGAKASAKELLDFKTAAVEGGTSGISEDGLRGNVRVALQYLDSWISGTGAVTIDNLMEDVATAEIARAELWQWVHHDARTEDGRPITESRYRQIRAEEQLKLRKTSRGKLEEAAEVLDGLVLARDFRDFLTTSANRFLTDLTEVVQS